MTPLLMTETSIKDNLLPLNWIACIHYLIYLKKNKVWASIDLNSKVNAIILEYALKLSLKIFLPTSKLKKFPAPPLKYLELC